MSDNAQADNHAIHELDTLVRHLADELAAFRRRALTAEVRLKEENEKLRIRLDDAAARTKQMLDRVRFLRQQAQTGG
jgi:regulator of replication initiation timing